MKTLAEILKHTTPNGNCLEWTRCFNTDGYPRMGWKGSTNGKVHRIVYELHTGEEITGKVVRHTCDNPACINPDHLLTGTPTDNMRDRDERGRTYNHVGNPEVLAVNSLRSQGYTYHQIADTLSIKPKRVEYILTRMNAL